MRSLRQIHLYLGCLFAPLIFYFSLSGAWQLYRLNDVPKDHPDALRSWLHGISNAHLHSLPPGVDPRKFGGSPWFTGAALLMALGLVATTSIGIVLAFRFGRRPRLISLLLALGAALPIILLYLFAPLS